MSSAKWVRSGPFIPFVRPIPVPFFYADEEPRFYLCVNEEWTIYINSAIVALTKDVTWDTDDEAILYDIERQADWLTTEWKEGCPVIFEPLTWDFDITTGTYTDARKIHFYDQVNGETSQIVANGQWFHLVGNTIQSPFVPCGGQISYVKFIADTWPSTIQVNARDCLDVLHTWNGANVFEVGDLGVSPPIFKDFDLISVNPGTLTIENSGPYSCIEA